MSTLRPRRWLNRFMRRAPTGDFDSYLLPSALTGVERSTTWLSLRWHDSFSARYHYLWLRDNCPCAHCVHQVTREQTFELVTVPSSIVPQSAAVDHGVLELSWPDGHTSHYDPGWLRAHAYSESVLNDALPKRVTWDASLGHPPTFDGPAILYDDEVLREWLRSLCSHGCSLVRNVAHDNEGVEHLARRIGPIRDTNFGLVWDVVAEPDPITNANTSLPLPPHVDLPTREYQPGLQFLHCLVNEAEGGRSMLVDGFRLAEEVRNTRPDLYEVLTAVAWNWANRSRTSDYRFVSPILVTDAHGELTEVRFGNWLRAPLTSISFDEVERAYEAYRYIFGLSLEPRFTVEFRLDPGDCIVFDNRRILHARGAFSVAGRRHLRGCYTERDELYSRLRILERAKRVQLLGDPTHA